MRTLWEFARPHTIIGSALSICSLFVIALQEQIRLEWLWQLLLPSLLAALACNVYITGLNQWSDVEVDRINKPWLPIPAGKLSRANALRIVLVCGALAIGLSLLFHWHFTLLIASIMAIGTAYSLPPLKFKRSHLLAASAISLVRGILVNLGFYLHFFTMGEQPWFSVPLPAEIWPLAVFVIAFSLGIAWFKDIPDTKGDAAYRFGTLAVRLGRSRAFLLGVGVVSIAYLYVAVAAWVGQLPAPVYYSLSHLAPLALFLFQAWKLQVSDDKQVKRFYMFFWGLFFLEYVVYPLGLLI